MSIKIGNDNKISNSSIGHNSTNIPEPSKKDFFSRHPILTILIIPFVISSIVAFIFLFDFWKDIINWITDLFS